MASELSLQESDPYLPLFFPSLLVQFLVARDYDLSKLLQGTGLNEKALYSPQTRVSLKCLRRLIHNCESAWVGENLGLSFGRSLTLQSLGMIGQAALASPTLEEALKTIHRYMTLRDPLQAYDIQQHPQGLMFKHHSVLEEGDTERFITEAACAAAIAFAHQLCGETCHGVEFFFRHSPLGRQEEYYQCLGDRVVFNADDTCYIAPSILLSRQLFSASPMSAAEARQYCESELERFSDSQRFNAVVRTLLRSQLSRPPTETQAAVILGHSERNLRRRLQREGTTYRQLLKEIRQESAEVLLTTSHQPIEQIALKLGYQNVGNFSRAFKRWTGSTPNQFRQTPN